MLSRKYYELIAQCIKNNKIYSNNSTRRIIKMDSLINDLCKEFKADNNLFNRDKFIDACD
jgi:hypothetical protein